MQKASENGFSIRLGLTNACVKSFIKKFWKIVKLHPFEKTSNFSFSVSKKNQTRKYFWRFKRRGYLFSKTMLNDNQTHQNWSENEKNIKKMIFVKKKKKNLEKISACGALTFFTIFSPRFPDRWISALKPSKLVRFIANGVNGNTIGIDKYTRMPIK